MRLVMILLQHRILLTLQFAVVLSHVSVIKNCLNIARTRLEQHTPLAQNNTYTLLCI